MVIVFSKMIKPSLIELTWLDSNSIVWREKERSLADIQILRSTEKETPSLS